MAGKPGVKLGFVMTAKLRRSTDETVTIVSAERPESILSAYFNLYQTYASQEHRSAMAAANSKRFFWLGQTS